MDTKKKFDLIAQFEYRPKDQGFLDSERTSYGLISDALSAAGTLWKSGNYERVYVADHEPVWRDEWPFLLWIKHRAERWIVLHDGTVQLLIPGRRPLTPNLLWRVPVNEACAVIDTHTVAPGPLEVSETCLREVLQTIWDFHNTMNSLVACKTRLYFYGLKVNRNRADVFFREEVL